MDAKNIMLELLRLSSIGPTSAGVMLVLTKE